MSHSKLVTIIGIHAREALLDTAEETEAAWAKALANEALVAAVLFQGGRTAPLSGQSFYPVRTEYRDIETIRIPL